MAPELMTTETPPCEAREKWDGLIEEILTKPYRIIDVFPKQVPAAGADRYASADRYYRDPLRREVLCRKYAEILLRLNCYFSMQVTFDRGETWEEDPPADELTAKFMNMSPQGVRVLFPPQHTLLDLDAGDTWMTVYDPEPELWDLLKKMAEAEGFFTWQPPEEEPADAPEYLYNPALCPCPRGEKAGCPRYRNCEACIAYHRTPGHPAQTACEKKAGIFPAGEESGS